MLAAIDVLHTERMVTLEVICATVRSQHVLQAVQWPQAKRRLQLKERTGAAWSNLVQGLPPQCTLHEYRWPTLLKVSAKSNAWGP